MHKSADLASILTSVASDRDRDMKDRDDRDDRDRRENGTNGDDRKGMFGASHTSYSRLPILTDCSSALESPERPAHDDLDVAE
jgi:hypothetical protein